MSNLPITVLKSSYEHFHFYLIFISQSRKDGKKLAPYLRVVAEELIRAADILDSKTDDMIDFFDEVNKTIETDYKICNEVQNGVNGHELDVAA